jgi:hypothetical protein
MIYSKYHEVNEKNGQMPTQYHGKKLKNIEMLAKVSIPLFKMPYPLWRESFAPYTYNT